MSAISKAEAYNEAFLKEENVAIFQKFLRLNPKVGHHFNRQVEEECEVSGEDNEEQLQVNTEDDGVVGGVQPGERNQRQVSHFEMHFRDC